MQNIIQLVDGDYLAVPAQYADCRPEIFDEPGKHWVNLIREHRIVARVTPIVWGHTPSETQEEWEAICDEVEITELLPSNPRVGLENYLRDERAEWASTSPFKPLQ